MVTKELLRQVIYEQRELTGSLGVERNVCQNISKTPEILVVSGVRRCGKSVMMMQIKASQDEQDYYFNFDDDRLLHFTVEDFQTLYEVFVEDFGVQHTFYLDEIQLIIGWERFVDRLYNHGNKVFVTGSNAYMLSKELGTLLTGRHIKQELYPMSLDEYAKLKGMSWQKTDFFTTAGKAKMLNMQSGYLKEGGFPQYLNTGDPRYLRELYNDIIYRDIVVRHKLPSDRQIKEVAYYLASNYTHKFTYQSVAKAANIKSTETVNDYIGYLEESYLVGILTKYDNKVGEQIKSPKKVYFIDNGLVSQIGFSFSENHGKKLENAVYIELRRRDAKIFYYYDNVECDFIVRDMAKITAAYQVTVSLKDLETRKRELNGLISAMDAFGLKEGFIITLDEIEEIAVDDDRLIHVLPYYRWCLEKSQSK
ncbi:MAG: ATP-binding protein [Bacteroidia bacterium]|nr:ATP-binding protein [Bacteroidia bacterium]